MSFGPDLKDLLFGDLLVRLLKNTLMTQKTILIKKSLTVLRNFKKFTTVILKLTKNFVRNYPTNFLFPMMEIILKSQFNLMKKD